MTCPRSQNQPAGLQPGDSFHCAASSKSLKKKSKFSFKIADMYLRRQSSSVLLLEKGRKKKKEKRSGSTTLGDTCSRVPFCTAFGTSSVDISWLFQGEITASAKCSWTRGPMLPGPGGWHSGGAQELLIPTLSPQPGHGYQC